jgi:hypothetical protein
LWIGAGVEQIGDHVWCQLLQDPSAAGEERVRLEEVGDAVTRDAERVVRRGLRLDTVALEHHGFMSRARDRERCGKPGDTAPGDYDPHCATLLRAVIPMTAPLDGRVSGRKLGR